MEVKQMMKLFLKIYGAYWYVRGYLDGMFTSMKYASKAMVIYMETKNNGGFDEVTRAKLMKLARKYQMEDPLHENVYDIIRKFDECINILNIGIHYF